MTDSPKEPSRTRWSRVEDRDYDFLVERYWRPVRRFYFDRVGSDAEADDMAQELFLSLFERDGLRRASASRGPFRRFLFQCARNLLIDRHRLRSAAKRGADRQVPLPDRAEDTSLLGADPSALFDRDWFLSIYNRARRVVKEHYENRGRIDAYRAFRLFYFGDETPERWTQKRIAQRLGLPITQINNYIHRARAVFVQAVQDAVAEYAGSDEEFETELAEMAGILGTDARLGEAGSSVDHPREEVPDQIPDAGHAQTDEEHVDPAP